MKKMSLFKKLCTIALCTLIASTTAIKKVNAEGSIPFNLSFNDYDGNAIDDFNIESNSSETISLKTSSEYDEKEIESQQFAVGFNKYAYELKINLSNAEGLETTVAVSGDGNNLWVNKELFSIPDGISISIPLYVAVGDIDLSQYKDLCGNLIYYMHQMYNDQFPFSSNDIDSIDMALTPILSKFVFNYYTEINGEPCGQQELTDWNLSSFYFRIDFNILRKDDGKIFGGIDYGKYDLAEDEEITYCKIVDFSITGIDDFPTIEMKDIGNIVESDLIITGDVIVDCDTLLLPLITNAVFEGSSYSEEELYNCISKITNIEVDLVPHKEKKFEHYVGNCFFERARMGGHLFQKNIYDALEFNGNTMDNIFFSNSFSFNNTDSFPNLAEGEEVWFYVCGDDSLNGEPAEVDFGINGQKMNFPYTKTFITNDQYEDAGYYEGKSYPEIEISNAKFNALVLEASRPNNKVTNIYLDNIEAKSVEGFSSFSYGSEDGCVNINIDGSNSYYGDKDLDVPLFSTNTLRHSPWSIIDFRLNINVSNGHFIIPTNGLVSEDSTSYENESGHTVEYEIDYTLKISGGSYGGSIDDDNVGDVLQPYVEDGYVIVKDTTDDNYPYKVVKASYKNDENVYFHDLSSALGSILATGGEVTVLEDVYENNFSGLLAAKQILDLNGHNLTVNSMAGIGGIIKDSGIGEKGSLTHTADNGFAYVNKPFEKIEISTGYKNEYAYVPVKVGTNKYEFYQAKIGCSKKTKLTGYWTENDVENCQMVVGAYISEGDVNNILPVQNDVIGSGVDLGVRVHVSDEDKNFTFNVATVGNYVDKAKDKYKPYFKFVGLDKTKPIVVNGFVFNDDANYKYHGLSQTVSFTEITNPNN